MKIAIAGASGQAGSRITAELARRGHQVTDIARNPDRIERLPNVTPVKGDVFDQAGLTRLVGAALDSKVGRYLVVGGAGSLEVAPGVRLVSTPGFPAQYKPEAEKGAAFLDLLRLQKDLNWTFLSPSALFTSGERTGRFRLGGDQLLTDPSGKSWISFEDFAVALADEIERPSHPRARFTGGY